MTNESIPHRPVLYQEIILALRPQSPGYYIDGTLGAGGHAFGILEASQPEGKLLGLDVDPQALQHAQERLSPFTGRATIVQASYTTMAEQLKRLGWPLINGIVLDLGASSMQFDTAERGFSFQVEAPLDMRFNPLNPVSAYDLVNSLPEDELANILYEFGEERLSRRIARTIVMARPVKTTRQLADLVRRAVGGKKEGIHPATRTFQALRIAVNEELDSIRAVLPMAINALAPGGRLAVIAFHSLEDRIVKQYFRQESRDCICPPRQPVCICGHKAKLIEVTRHPIQAQETEVRENPRARSAKLRVAERLHVQ